MSKAPAELTSEAENAAKSTTMSSILGWAITSNVSATKTAAAAAPDTASNRSERKTSSIGSASERDTYATPQHSGLGEHRVSHGGVGAFAQQANGGSFGGATKDSGWDDAGADDGDGWGDLGLMDDDFDGGSAVGAKRETNGGESSAFGTPVTAFSGGSRGGSTDIASLDVKVSEGLLLPGFCCCSCENAYSSSSVAFYSV